MWMPLFLRKWLNSRKPPKEFVPGMVLDPGESCVFDMPLPDDVQSRLDRLVADGHVVTVTQGPTIQTGNDFYSDIIVTVDGVPEGSVRLSWSMRDDK